jgi:hypothetical protein
MANNSALGPITPHGNVVVNAAFDSGLFASKRSNPDSKWKCTKGDSDHVVAKNDLVFKWRRGNKRKRAAYNEPELRVFSTCNGLSVPKGGSDSKEGSLCDNTKLKEGCAFIGVSNADLVPGVSKHAAITVAGLLTIQNTGFLPIEAGDKVVWDLPKPSNGERQVFITKPYSNSIDEYVTSVAQAITDGGSDSTDGGRDAGICAKLWGDAFEDLKGGNNSRDAFNSLKTFLKCFCQMTKEVDSRVIGTALSSAQVNAPMDVLIRYGK